MKFNAAAKTKNSQVNYEGAKSYPLTPAWELYTAVVTTSLSDQFYEKADDLRTENNQMTTLKTEPYLAQQEKLPKSGSQIIAHYNDELIVVYQAYKPSIAEFATKNKRLGGNDFSFNRMSWIKPNFLWMMFRSGWATKENQESILAIWLARPHFEAILEEAVHTSFSPAVYEQEGLWKRRMETSEVRIQWDPDHDPFGKPLDRRAVQLGLKGRLLQQFATDWIVDMQDITPFVKEQSNHLKVSQLSNLQVPEEQVYRLSNESLRKKAGVREPI